MQNVLSQLPNDDIKVYVVWEPIRFFDGEGAAVKSQALVPDPRTRHFWARDFQFASSVQAPFGLAAEPVWDVYLLYAGDATWGREAVPVPRTFMHQLPGRLPDEKLLNESELVGRVQNLLEDGPHRAIVLTGARR